MSARIFDRQGSALTEAIIIAPTLLALVSGLLIGTYTAICWLWIDYSTYEALICMAAQTSPSTCERRLLSQIRAGLKVGQTLSLHLQRRGESYHARVYFRVAGPWLIQRERSLNRAWIQP